jgi:hypothetical protein
MSTITDYVDWCLILFSTESAGHISKWRVPALVHNGRLSEEECKPCKESYYTSHHHVSIVGHFLAGQGLGYQTLVCLNSSDDCHLSVHLEIMFSLSSFLIALLAISPEPSTDLKLPPAFASLSASPLPRMPTWALTHSRTTVFFLPSYFRVSLVSLHVFLVISVESSVFRVA